MAGPVPALRLFLIRPCMLTIAVPAMRCRPASPISRLAARRRGDRHARPSHPKRHPARWTHGHRHRHPGRTDRRGGGRNRGAGPGHPGTRVARHPALRRPPLPSRLGPERGPAPHQPQRHPARGHRDLGRPRSHPDPGGRQASRPRALPLVDRPRLPRDPEPRGRDGRFADGGGCAAGAPRGAWPLDRPPARRIPAERLLPLPELARQRRPALDRGVDVVGASPTSSAPRTTVPGR